MSDPMFDSSLDRQIRAYAEGGLRPFDRYAIAQGLVAGSRRRGLWWLPGIGRPLLSRSYVLVVVSLMLALLAIAVAGAYLRREDTPQPQRGRNGLIAYQIADMDRAPWNHVHVMNADGSGDREVLAGVDPRYSQDGSVLVVVGDSSTQGSRLLTITDPDGATERFVGDARLDQFGISPDGSRVALVEPDRGLWLLSLDDYPRHRPLVPYTQRGYPSQYVFPEWSPDGSHIAYAEIRSVETASGGWGFRDGIGIVNVATGETRLLTARPGDVFSGMSWSPDGTYLAYLGLPDGAPSPLESSINASAAQDVFTIRLSDGFESNITQSAEAEWTAEWSPDGSAIAILDVQGSGFQISVVPVSAGEQTGESYPSRSFGYASNMVSSRIEDSFTWSPDARSLLIASFREVDEPGGSFRPEYSLAEFDRGFTADPKAFVTSRSPIGGPTWQRLEP